MPLSAEEIWQEALGELQLQLTAATFDTWLGRTRLISGEDGTFVIGVHNRFAQEWLEGRLDGMIRRTLSGLAGKAVAVKFVVFGGTPAAVRGVDEPGEGALEAGALEASALEASEASPPVSVLPEMPDLRDVGYFPVSRYECSFWAPRLGRVAWRVWEIVRGADIRKEKSEWTSERRWSAPELARLVPCGPQAIVGVNREAGRQAGALDRLAASGVGRHRRQGDARDPHTMYVMCVRVRLPLLTPSEVMGLSDSLRHRHDRWLEEHGFDPREWFVSSG
jgi:hypothetical protein